MPPKKSPPVVEPSAPESAQERRIYALIRARIIQWHYPPGFHLGEKPLSEEFSVSRVPVREALRALTAEGLVVKKPNQGCFVKQLNVAEAKELFEVRIALESHVVESLSKGAHDAGWLGEQRAFWRSVMERPGQIADVSGFVEADNAFHLGLARAMGNSSVLAIIEEVTDRLRFIKLAVEADEARLTETAREHLEIIESILRHDAPAAREAVRENIEHSSNRVELAIGRALVAAHARSGG